MQPLGGLHFLLVQATAACCRSSQLEIVCLRAALRDGKQSFLSPGGQVSSMCPAADAVRSGTHHSGKSRPATLQLLDRCSGQRALDSVSLDIRWHPPFKDCFFVFMIIYEFSGFFTEPFLPYKLPKVPHFSLYALDVAHRVR